jgi:hypothetical protein
MSSNWSRLNYDNCSYKQQVDLSIEPGMYNFFLPRFENNLGVSSKVLPCDTDMMKKINCDPCNHNKDAFYNNDINTINNDLLDINCELRQYNKLNSKCNDTKYNPNNNECAGDFKKCGLEKYVVNPLLCDRSIVPTNMKMTTSNGLKYF